MTQSKNVVIVDYRVGNTHSLERSLKRCGLSPVITSDPAVIEQADGVLMPGVGAFGPAMESLMETGASAAIRRFVDSGRPVLAICLGMQLLADEGEEGGHHRGLSIIPGRVRRLAPPQEHSKIPQIAWNEIMPVADDWRETVLDGLQGRQMYFLHSYVVDPARPEDRVAETDYMGDCFCAAYRSANVHGVQFHPELSAEAGQAVFRNFVRLIDETAQKNDI
ncbi:imidazole glycerol phosphate synthase subunit HisH [Rhodospirillaceae bacterium KN72]|uniref:Imidazole glycerol phosphate synthase subunit HisH n=1 Tax=Pacificispira spongiicola TaxID=2729598 RepID=A0A7Y0HH44_9PROT|nr:imidazole glycerol phosphate synthase subunit HisH [Pacificispira spongiicola]NMM45577.1 imidazole glycerol phosphate synthase subunit HisH [Pacificispira spongiicola]